MTGSTVSTAHPDVCREYLVALSKLDHIPSIFLLKLGRPWQAQALPGQVSRGRPRQCYENAGTLAMSRPDLTYVEGYACPPGIPPVHHAWCVDADGCVVDNTFTDPEDAKYYGVPISRAKLEQFIQAQKHWGLFAEQMTPETLNAAIADVQAGPWAVDADAAESVLALLRPHLTP